MLKTLLPFSLLVACFGLFETAAQLPQPAQDIVDRNVPNPLLKSPNVAALGKFGDYPVSHYTGLPEISIPILEATSGELKVAISLSYHASGVKPTDPDGWVGTGWSLTGGGQISRSIQGKPDEEHYAVTELKADLSNCDYPEGAGTFYYLQYAARGVTDTEPDIFSYSYPDGRGKFLLPYNEDPYLVPYRPIKLQRFPGKFELVDEKGILPVVTPLKRQLS